MAPANWVLRRDRRRARNDLLRFIATLLAVNVTAILVVFQLRYGVYGGLGWARQSSVVVLVITAVLDAGAVASPRRAGSLLTRAVLSCSRVLFSIAATALVVGVYVTSLPFARAVGTREFVRRHEASLPWAVPGTPWRRSTWHRKQLRVVGQGMAGGSTLLRALGFFIRERNYFLFAVALALLVLAAFTVFAQTSPVAPFIYPLL